MRRPNVLLADDHAIVAEGVSRLLGHEFDLVGIVSDGEQLVEAARRLRPDLIVTDMSMPVLSGLEALRRLRADRPDARVVCLTQHADVGLAGEVLRAGAVGYVLKAACGEELVTAMRQALAGRVFISPQIAGEVVTALAMWQGTRAGHLTPRQREVLRLVGEGRTMKEVAAAMRLSRRTVEGHKYEMMQNLGIESTAGLVRYAVRHGMVTC